MAGADLPKLSTKTFSYGDRKVTLGILRGHEQDGLPYGRVLPLVEGHLLVAAFNAEHGTSLAIINPRLADRIIADTSAWFFFGKCSPFLTDSIIAYEDSRCMLGQEITYASSGFRFVVPSGKYRGEEGTALLVCGVTAADFNIQKTDVVVSVPAGRILPIRGFPTESSMAIRHPMLTARFPDEQNLRSIVLYAGLPRRVWRQYQSSYVGPVARTTSPTENWHHILVNRNPTSGFGIVVEIPDRDAGKFKEQY